MPKFGNFFKELKQGAKGLGQDISNLKVKTNQHTPDAKKNFLQNYSDHLDQLEIDAKKYGKKQKTKVLSKMP
ncbi:hypothetical protein [Legionella tunisiensis]|uniref:hypothetical protein n=1 Tax=Legionella tunisiensis TaxID=1034944 RepID=UPI0002F03331|nr:hypothetical protein [Legionella tunisiensis]